MPYCAPTTDPDSDTTSNNTVFFDSEPPPTAMSDPTVPVPAPAAPSLQDLLTYDDTVIPLGGLCNLEVSLRFIYSGVAGLHTIDHRY
ncbi:uncharacterized protein BROUX77_002597 [Berkeleyomyces rouxiae]|uniref:uncharacterized protein n=1 Tax=Berkeleyomyces rouxiae TaxID=2035830 RepID=UPI003B7F05BD